MALGDVFVKPERALMWVLQSPPNATGANYGMIPFGATTSSIVASSNYGTGDITTSVASSGSAYVAQPVVTTPQPPQAQPSQVCGQVYGFTTAPNAAAASTFAVLEPVNFAPLVQLSSVNSTLVGGATNGKGVAVSVENLATALAVGPNATYDYNDKDPCYTPSRSQCNDNGYLTEWLFSGTGGSATQTPAQIPLAPGTFNTGFNNIAIASGSKIVVAVADQTVWADSNTLSTTSTGAIAGGTVATVTPQSMVGILPGMSILVDGGTSLSEVVVVRATIPATQTTPGSFTASFVNSHLVGATLASPFAHEGNFLTGLPVSAGPNTPVLLFPVCDPGSPLAGYSPSGPCPIANMDPAFVAGAQYGTQTYLFGGSGYLFGNVGATEASTVTSGSSSGLIPLPTPTNPTGTSPLPSSPTTSTNGAITGGQVNTVTPASMAGIVPGDTILVVSGAACPATFSGWAESTVVLTTTATSFTASFAGSYPANSCLGLVAAVTVTAGQSASFVWNWLPNQSATGTYNLTRYEVDAATLSVETAPPAGFCNLPATYVFGSSPAQTAPTIYVVTTGTLNARNTPPAVWGGAGGVVLALLIPLFVGRRGRSLRKQLHLMLLLLVLAGVASLSGCGAGFVSPVAQVTPPGTYYFRAAATSGSNTITTAPFEVIVLKGD